MCVKNSFSIWMIHFIQLYVQCVCYLNWNLLLLLWLVVFGCFCKFMHLHTHTICVGGMNTLVIVFPHQGSSSSPSYNVLNTKSQTNKQKSQGNWTIMMRPVSVRFIAARRMRDAFLGFFLFIFLCTLIAKTNNS